MNGGFKHFSHIPSATLPTVVSSCARLSRRHVLRANGKQAHVRLSCTASEASFIRIHQHLFEGVRDASLPPSLSPTWFDLPGGTSQLRTRTCWASDLPGLRGQLGTSLHDIPRRNRVRSRFGRASRRIRSATPAGSCHARGKLRVYRERVARKWLVAL